VFWLTAYLPVEMDHISTDNPRSCAKVTKPLASLPSEKIVKEVTGNFMLKHDGSEASLSSLNRKSNTSFTFFLKKQRWHEAFMNAKCGEATELPMAQFLA
jgi:hypothetical protein